MADVIDLANHRGRDATMTDLAALVDPRIAPPQYRSIMFSLRPLTPAEAAELNLSGDRLFMVTSAETRDGKPTFARFAAQATSNRADFGQWDDCPHLAIFQSLEWLCETQPDWMIAAQAKAATP